MADRKYYVLCSNNCKFESMTKEQILTAIEQAVNTGEIENVDTGFITTIKESNRGKGLTFWIGKQAEYNAIKVKKENCFYIITDDTSAEDIENAIHEMKNEIEQATQFSNKLFKSLWADSEGAANGSDIIVSNAANYTMFKIHFKGSATPIIASRISDIVRGSGSSLIKSGGNFTGVEEFYFIAETTAENATDEKWVLNACERMTHAPNGNHGAIESKTITRIMGII